MDNLYTKLINEVLQEMLGSYNEDLSKAILSEHLDPFKEVTSGSKGFTIGQASYSVTNLQGLSSMTLNKITASNINGDGNSLTGTVALHASFSEDLNATVSGSVSFNLNGVGHAISSTASTVGDGIESVASTVGHGITSTASTVGNGVKSVASTVGHGITSTASTVGNGIKSVASTFGNGVASAISTIGSAFSWLLSIPSKHKKVINKPQIFASDIGISGNVNVNDVVISGTATVYAQIEGDNLKISKIDNLSVSTSYSGNPSISINGAGVANKILRPLEQLILSKTKESIESLVNEKLTPVLQKNFGSSLPKITQL